MSDWRLAKSLEVLRRQINERWPDRDKDSDGTIGDRAHSARVSDHNPNDDGVVCALDVTDDASTGVSAKAITEALRRSKDPRIKYVIFDGRMYSSYKTSATPAWKWRHYSGANPHRSHFHVSVHGEVDDESAWNIDEA